MKVHRPPKPENWRLDEGYVPYLKTHQALGTHGVKSRIPGRKSGRIHHLISQWEAKVFRLLEWSEDVEGIFEQFALDPEMTQRIALAKKLKHPAIPTTGEIAVMTTDFLVRTQENRIEVIAVKEASDLNESRTLEKLEIEQEFWRGRNVPWRIVTEKELPMEFCDNLDWVHTAPDLELTPAMRNALEGELGLRLTRGTRIVEACSESDRSLRLEVGTSLNFLRQQLATKRWRTDMNRLIRPEGRITLWT